MPDIQHSFVIPDNQSIPSLVSSLKASFPVQEQAETVYHRVFYDTFDWRLYKNGSALEVYDDGKSQKIYWRADRDGKLKIQLGLKKTPRLATDLPAGEFRQQLQSVITVRELLPRIKLRINRHSYAVLDENEKIVVRLHFDVYWYEPSRLRAARVLTRRLTIKAVKGYAKDYQRVEAFFQAMPLLMPMPIQSSQDNVMKLALIATDVSTDEYSTSLILRLDPEIPAEQVLKEIILRLLEIMRQNTAGCIRGRDTEYMHDYRVAIRKIRVALKQLRQLEPQAAISDYMSFFKTLGRLSNPVRDRDVFLRLLENYQTHFEEEGWQQLQPLRDYLLSSRAVAQKTLVKELKSSQYRENMKNLRHYLEQDETEDETHDRPISTVRQLADEKLWAINQSVLEQGKTINNSDAETLHDLRKTFKQLRYLIEFFRGLYPAVELRVLSQTLIDVQDDLGEFNDRHIQAGMVKAFIEQSDNEDAIKASEQIMKILRQQQDEAGKRFKTSYKAYSSSRSQKKLKEMFVEYYGRKN